MRQAHPAWRPRTLGPEVPAPRFHTTQSPRDPSPGNRVTPGRNEQALYDDLRNDRLGDRVRLEQERVKYQLVQKVVLSLHR